MADVWSDIEKNHDMTGWTEWTHKGTRYRCKGGQLEWLNDPHVSWNNAALWKPVIFNCGTDAVSDMICEALASHYGPTPKSNKFMTQIHNKGKVK
jgi:hypothetical protein